MKLADLIAAGGYVVATGRTIGALPLCRYTAQGGDAIPLHDSPTPAPRALHYATRHTDPLTARRHDVAAGRRLGRRYDSD